MKDIAGFENEYGITSCGKVWSYKTSKFLKTSYDKDGYERITLVNSNGIRNSYLIHRLVAQAYIPNKLNLSDVNHIDRIKKHIIFRIQNGYLVKIIKNILIGVERLMFQK